MPFLYGQNRKNDPQKTGELLKKPGKYKHSDHVIQGICANIPKWRVWFRIIFVLSIELCVALLTFAAECGMFSLQNGTIFATFCEFQIHCYFKNFWR